MKKLLITILVFCCFSAYSNDIPPQFDNKAWDTLKSMMVNSGADKLAGAAEKATGVSLEFEIKGHSISVSNMLDAMRAIEAAAAGDWKTAREQTADSTIAYFMPMVGQYMALHSSLRTAGEAILENWSEKLYETKAYRKVVNLMNENITTMAKQNEPFLPSSFFPNADREDNEFYDSMYDLERQMYWLWISTNPTEELNNGGNRGRMRQLFGADPSAEDVFYRFYNVAVRDQLGFIQTTFERVSAQAAQAAQKKMYEEIARQVKRELDSNSRPRDMALEVSGDKATAVFRGSPGYEYKLSVFGYNNFVNLPSTIVERKTVKAGDGLNRVVFDYQLGREEDSLVFYAEDQYGKFNSVTLKVIDNLIVADFFVPAAYGVSGEPVMTSNTVYTGSDIEIRTHVRSFQNDPPIRLRIKEAYSGRVIHTSTDYKFVPDIPAGDMTFYLSSGTLSRNSEYIAELESYGETIAGGAKVKSIKFKYIDRPKP